MYLIVFTLSVKSLSDNLIFRIRFSSGVIVSGKKYVLCLLPKPMLSTESMDYALVVYGFITNQPNLVVVITPDFFSLLCHLIFLFMLGFGKSNCKLLKSKAMSFNSFESLQYHGAKHLTIS